MPIKALNTNEFRFQRKETYSHEDMLEAIRDYDKFAVKQHSANMAEELNELQGFKNAEIETAHNTIVEEALTDFNIADGRKDGVLKLADISKEDDKATITNKIKKVKEDYKEFFTAKSSAGEEINKIADPSVEVETPKVYL